MCEGDYKQGKQSSESDNLYFPEYVGREDQAAGVR